MVCSFLVTSFSGFGVMTMFKVTKDQLDDIYREQETTKSDIASLNLKKEPEFYCDLKSFDFILNKIYK